VSAEIIVVSGLPRSGTSLMMQMLEGGGVAVLTDGIRTADADNPRGYFEFERVKKLKEDRSWLPEARGKVVKVVSQLLYHLPSSERYRIVFLERDLEEVLRSQEKMLERRGRGASPREEMRRAFTLHLEGLHDWLARQGNMPVLRVGFSDLVEQPRREAERVREFLGGVVVEVEGMVKLVDPTLYRNRKTPSTSTAPRSE
jgi:hypothetical protein